MAALAQSFSVTAKLDDNPNYAGSAHDTETARRMGFRAALIPGAFVYGHATRLAVRLWGIDWISRGSIAARFRRPVYDGDQLLVAANDPVEDGEGQSLTLTVTSQEGEAVLVGRIGLPAMPPALPGELPIMPSIAERAKHGEDEIRPGTPITTRNVVLTPEQVEDSRRAFAETEPIYKEGDLVHSGCLVRLTMGDTLQTFAFREPVIFAAVETQNFAPLQPGRRMSTSGVITAVYERRGKLYFDSEEYLIADEIAVIARHSRVNLYATREG